MKKLTVTIGDELWQAFKNTYELKNKTKLEHDQEPEYEARDLMYEAIKAYVLNDNSDKQRTIKEAIDEPCSDSLVMIPVHEWIWQKFKDAYPTRFDDDEDIDRELIKVAHDWICRAIQYYTDQGIEDPWTILEAYKIALDCPDIRIRREHGVWIINTAHMFDVEAKNASELLRTVRSSKEYIEAAVPQRRTAKEVIDESMEIATSVPAMTVKKIAIPGYEGSAPAWIISFKDNDYTAEARGSEQLLREVKEAKDYYETLQIRNAKKCKAVKLDEDEEKHYVRLEKEIKVVKDESREIRIDGLEKETKELFLHFIDDLTIGYVAEVAGKRAHPSVWDELHYIRQTLKESIEKGRQRR